jgi:hypothetical protein
MTPQLLLLLPAVASTIALPLLGGPRVLDVAAGIQKLAGQFASETEATLVVINTAVTDIVRVAYVTCLLVGVLLYYTHIGRRLGKDLIIGGVLLVVIAEFLIPVVGGLIS